VFDKHDALVEAVREARREGLEIRDVYTPVPSHEILDIVKPKRSPVRFVTFAGGIIGLVSGIALAEWSSLEWNLVVGGKPVTSLVPFMVVGFELTILLGGVATLLALLLFSGLPMRRFPTRGFRPEFTKDRYGLWLAPASGQRQEALSLLEDGGAVQVVDLDEEEGGR
jgi:molybdopterin-containing oxidoreductase family membrane subunit